MLLQSLSSPGRLEKGSVNMLNMIIGIMLAEINGCIRQVWTFIVVVVQNSPDCTGFRL
jgi:hypothetical protein